MKKRLMAPASLLAIAALTFATLASRGPQVSARIADSDQLERTGVVQVVEQSAQASPTPCAVTPPDYAPCAGGGAGSTGSSAAAPASAPSCRPEPPLYDVCTPRPSTPAPTATGTRPPATATPAATGTSAPAATGTAAPAATAAATATATPRPATATPTPCAPQPPLYEPCTR